jgi:hypothetical protein
MKTDVLFLSTKMIRIQLFLIFFDKGKEATLQVDLAVEAAAGNV